MANGDMDIDMDVDLGLGDDLTAAEAEAMRADDIHPAPVPPPIQAQTNQVPPESSDAGVVTPHKIHIRGLDNLATSDINAFTSEYYPSAQSLRIEWIDDTSANVVYDTPATAMKALESFTMAEEGAAALPTLQLRAAKPHPAHREGRLEVRLAVHGDRKAPGARERSRFYLFNPDQDPVERRQREGKDRRGRPGRHDNSNYRRRNYDDREHRRRRAEDEDAGFDESLYDDDASALASRENRQRRRQSYSSYSSSGDGQRDGRDKRVRFTGGRGSTKELFPDRVGANGGSRLRDRSASPEREQDRDGDEEMGLDSRPEQRNRSNGRSRRLTPPSPVDMDQSPQIQVNGSKELFPGKLVLDEPLPPVRPSTSFSSTGSKELFPHKQVRNHRRSDAFDAADETADLFAGQFAVPFTDGTADRRAGSKKLADRISFAPSTEIGRLTRSASDGEKDVAEPTPNNGFSIRGAAEGEPGFSIRGAAKQLDTGFSIRGAASHTAINTRELFPGKRAGNAGKELFADRLEGRGGKRRKAEDMFH